MPIIVSDSYKIMSEKCVNDLLEYIYPLRNPVICTASGDTQKGMYAELVKQVYEKNIDVSGWQFVGLDEWVDMNGNDEGSCRYHLNNDLFDPLGIVKDKIVFFDGRAKNLQAECDGVEDYINLIGGIDVAILGIGMNGHVGMNEPGTSAKLYSHVADIDASTQLIGQKYFKSKKQLTKGLTLGLASLAEVSFIMLLANGIKKSDIVLKILGEDPSEQLPAALLLRHKNICMYLDKEAAPLVLRNEK